MDNNKRTQVITALSKQGQNPVQGTQYDMIQIFKSWYRGNVNNFHRYKTKSTKGSYVEREKLTFNAPKKIAEEWVSILINEKVILNTDDQNANEIIDKVFYDNSFRVEFSDALEKTFGYAGTGAMVQYLVDGEIVIDYIIGENLIVTQGKGTQAKGIVTINEIKDNDKYITHLTMHTLEKDSYIIEHKAYISNSESELGKPSSMALQYIFTQKELLAMQVPYYDENGKVIDVKYEIEYETNIPMFQVFRPNITNNFDVNAQMGLPVTANSIDAFKALDNAFDALNNENVNSKTITVFNEKATRQKAVNKPSTGETQYITYVDDQDTSFIAVPMGDNEDWVKHFKGDFTDAEQRISAVNNQLSWATFKCGLGANYWKFDGSNSYQNEKHLMSDNNDLWKNKTKHEIILRKALVGAMKAILYLSQELGEFNGNIETINFNVHFDDSIIIDDEALRANSLDLVQRGFKPKWKHLVEFEDMTKKEAKASVAEASKEQDDAFFTFNDRVDNGEESS